VGSKSREWGIGNRESRGEGVKRAGGEGLGAIPDSRFPISG